MYMIGGALKSFKFNILAFIIGFIIGICYIYQKQPPLIEQIVYPTPYNAGKVIYKSTNGDCFQYTAELVDCPEDKSLIKQHIMGSETPETENSDLLSKFKKFFN